MSGVPSRCACEKVVYVPPFLSPRLSTFAEFIFTRLVRTVYTVPRKNFWLSRASPPDGPKFGTLVAHYSTLLIN
jgi:hypothetical protein